MIHKLFTEFRTFSMIVIILIITVLIATIFKWVLKRYVKKSLLDHHKDLTGYLFINHIVTAVIYIIGIAVALVQIPELKLMGHSLLAGAGVLSLIAGLASQQALSNIMSGILIVIFKPFRINDKITIRGTFTGTVEDINLRQVVIRDFENNRIVIPNSVISSDLIVNAHIGEEKNCRMIDIGIGYSSNVERALEIMKEEVANHSLHIDGRSQEDIDNNVPLVIARVTALGDSSVNLRVWAWAKDSSDGYVMMCDLLKSIKKRFETEGIEIPFPQRTVTLKK